MATPVALGAPGIPTLRDVDLRSVQGAFTAVTERLRKAEALIGGTTALATQTTKVQGQANSSIGDVQTQIDALKAALAALDTPDGPSPTANLTFPAGATVGGHRVIALGTSGLVRHADASVADDADRVIGISNNAAGSGSDVVVTVDGGLLNEPSWNWSVDGAVFVTGLGMLTQAVPGPPNAFVLKIGIAASHTSILVQVGTAIYLGGP